MHAFNSWYTVSENLDNWSFNKWLSTVFATCCVAKAVVLFISPIIQVVHWAFFLCCVLLFVVFFSVVYYYLLFFALLCIIICCFFALLCIIICCFFLCCVLLRSCHIDTVMLMSWVLQLLISTSFRKDFWQNISECTVTVSKICPGTANWAASKDGPEYSVTFRFVFQQLEVYG